MMRTATAFTLVLSAAALTAASLGCGSDDAATGSEATGTTTGGGTGGEGGNILPPATSSSGTGTGAGGGSAACDPNPTEGLATAAAAFGDAASQLATGVALDGAGNVFVVGAFAGTLTFGNLPALTSAGLNDIFVVKLSADLTPVWAKRFGDAKDQSPRAVAVDPQGNVILTGRFLGTVGFGGASFTSPGCCFNQGFLVKLDGQTGDHVWSKSLGDVTDETPYGVAVDGSGNVAMVGEYQGTIDFGGGIAITTANVDDAFLAVFDPAGTIQWARSLGGTLDQSAHAVAFDEAGNVLVTGMTTGPIDFGMGPQDITGTQDVFVAKLTAAGALAWGKLFGASKSSGEGIAADAAGDVYLTGDHEGDISFGGDTFTTQLDVNAFAVKLTSDGAHVWSKSFGDNAAQHARGIAVDGAGWAVMTGDFGGQMNLGGGDVLASAGANDAFLIKLDGVGCAVWGKQFGDAGSQAGAAVSVSASGASAVAGRMAGSADFGTGVVTASGDDVFVARFAP